MILYHTTKTKRAVESLLLSWRIQPGRNVYNGKHYVHVSTVFPNWISMDVFGDAQSTQAWVMKILVDDETALLPDPSGEDHIYDGPGTWFIHEGALAFKPLEVTYFSNYRNSEQKGVRIR